jgi:hypothetical protein
MTWRVVLLHLEDPWSIPFKDRVVMSVKTCRGGKAWFCPWADNTTWVRGCTWLMSSWKSEWEDVLVIIGRSIKCSSPYVSWLRAMKWLWNVIRKNWWLFDQLSTDDGNYNVLKNPSSLRTRLMRWIIN